MKKIQKLLLLMPIITVLGLTQVALVAPMASAAVDGGGDSSQNTGAKGISDPCHPEKDDPPGQPLTADQLASCENCKKVKNNDQATLQKCLKNNPIIKDLNAIITFLSGLVGIVIIGAIIYGGIRYSIAGDSPQATAAAKQQIINALIALVAFISIFSILQWLIPGGLFS